MAHLEIRNLSKHFGAFVALDQVNLAVARGEFLVLLGPSGCGKTTLLRAIAGLERQDAGQIFHGGEEISARSPALRDYGIVFQSYALFPNLTVAGNVAYGLKSRKADRGVGREGVRRRVVEMLALVGLPGIEHKYPAQLSGGQQQRVALARALATSPDLLLLDEPLSALDAIERVRLRGEIRALQQRLGVTTIMVTHDQEEALSMADRIVVMNAGRIEQVGSPREVYGTPATPFVADFVGKINVLPGVSEGGGRFRVGSVTLGTDTDLPAGTAARLYLRPEEVGVHVNGAAPSHALPARVAKIEFLGAFCLVAVTLDGHDAAPLVANVSRQFADGCGLAPGRAVGVTLPAPAIRVLG